MPAHDPNRTPRGREVPDLHPGSPPAKRPYHHGDLAHAMVAQALSHVRSRGVERVSLRDVARDVGVSASAAYNHFQDKESLLRAVAAQATALLNARMAEAIAAHPGADDHAARARFVALGRAYLTFATLEPNLFRLTFGPVCAGQLPDASAPGAFQMLHDALGELERRDLLHPSVRPNLEMTIWAATHGMAYLLVEGAAPAAAAEPFLASILQLVTGSR